MRRVRLPLAVMVAMITSSAAAHVAPSVDDNNRYIKVSPQADRLRVAYTVFFGEVPGQALRPALDADHDGSISDGEAQSYGDKIAAEVIAALELAVDGKQQAFRWKQVAVGMGSPAVAAGSFSIDMIAYVCFPRAGGKHEALIRDRYRVPKPGETEVRVEDAPGITVSAARIGGSDALANDFKFVGPGGPLSDEGLKVIFTASDKAAVSGECNNVVAPASSSTPWLAIGLGIAALLVGGALVLRHSLRK